MTKKKAKHSGLRLVDSQLAELRMHAIRVAAGLPDTESYGGMMGGGPQVRPGKSAEKVVADATKILSFVMQAS